METHQLGAVDEAAAAEHKVGVVDAHQSVGDGTSFLRTPDVEDRVAILDGRAVHHPGHLRRHLARGHAGHRLVEEADPALASPSADERLATPQPPDCRQVGVAEALGDR